MSRSVVPFRVLSRTNLAYTPDTPALSPFVSEICGLFNSLCALFATPVVCFLQLGDSFCKTPGVGGYPALMLRFPRRMRHAAPLSLLRSFTCAYFLSPRGVPRRDRRRIAPCRPRDRTDPQLPRLEGLVVAESAWSKEILSTHRAECGSSAIPRPTDSIAARTRTSRARATD